MIEQFIKSYWEYYLELEAQLIETKRYVEFGVNNYHTYSVEYLKLYQAVCSEIDVVGKEIAQAVNPNFKVDDHTNIPKWGFQVQQQFGFIKDSCVLFNDDINLQPFENWEYEQYTDSSNRTRLRIVGGIKNVIKWWKNYNDVKHQRIGLVTGTKNYILANQENLVLAFAALFLLEKLFLEWRISEEQYSGLINESQLFIKL